MRSILTVAMPVHSVLGMHVVDHEAHSRDQRVPMYVKVVTRPPLSACWAVNVGASGMALVASVRRDLPGPRQGDEIEIEFSLPQSGATIRAKGEIRWRYEAPSEVTGQIAASLGVRFREVEGPGKVHLGRYVLGHRRRVAVALAAASDQRVLADALGRDVEPVFASCVADVRQLLGGGDICAVVVCGDSEDDAVALVDALAAERAPNDAQRTALARDLAPRVLYAGPASPARLVELFNAGHIFRALSLPLDSGVIATAVSQAIRDYEMHVEHQRVATVLEDVLLREKARADDVAKDGARGAVGFSSEAMQSVLDLVRIVAPHAVPVLLQGETGTGKEVLARMIHEHSPRRDAPFVVQDCGALSETLLESELFGHVKGAFTGASTDHPGLFVLANGGTILLDEIENTSPNLQAKLLRVIETGEVRPVGGTSVKQVDLRLIAASNRDLRHEVDLGRFRADMFYRLNTFPINVPPLRERQADILALARHFVASFSARIGREASGLTPGTEALLQAWDWPGNVRELKNAMERAVLLSRPGAAIAPERLPEPMALRTGERSLSTTTDGSLRDRVSSVERELIRQALDRTHGVISHAAKELRTDSVTLRRKAKRYGLRRGRASGGDL